MENRELVKVIIKAVGSESNIKSVTHCMTRLRFTLHDEKKVDKELLDNTEGIMGVVNKGGQYQLIIGPNVSFIYEEVVLQLPHNESLNNQSENHKMSLSKIINAVMDAIGACVAPMLPIITAAGLLKMIVAILGPTMLGVLPETSDFMRLLTFVGDAGFYFFPVYVAYSGAKKFGANIPMSLFIAGVLLHPTLFTIVGDGQPFTVYGIPMILTTYSTSFISMILITWVMSYVEKYLNKYIPDSLRALLFPLLLILIMLPIALCVLGPLGTICGELIASFITALHGILGPVAIALVAALWPLLIVTGMHQALIAIALTYIGANGFDSSILVGAFISNYSMIAICLAFLIKSKLPKDKVYATSSLITLALGGISEPTLFGIILRYKKAIAYLFAGGIAGGLYAGLMGVAVYFVGSGNLLVALGFAGSNPASLLHGVIASIITFVVAFVLSMIFGFGNDQTIELKKQGE